MNSYQRDICQRIISIIFTLVFLIGSSFVWKRLHDNYNMAYSFLNSDTQVILMEDIDICSDVESENLLGYQFTVTSNYTNDKNYSVKIVGDNIDKQDIHYTIDDSDILTLNSDNTIINRDIVASGEHNYKLKIWLTNNYEENDLNLVIDFK